MQIRRRSVLRWVVVGAVLSLGGGLSAPWVAAEKSAEKPAASKERFTGPWNVAEWKKTPKATWGTTSGLVQPVYYEGEPLAGKPTRVFAYVGRPADLGKGRKAPAMVLVHGGGGTAFSEWAELWAKRGYAAIAMDLGGCGPDGKRLPDGGPGQDDGAKFRNFTDAEARQMWTYHAVAAALRGHSLLASLEGVDPDRTGVTGISWGGYLTSIIAGVDDRFKVAVPVYGCGFLHQNSAWLPILSNMPPEQRDRWVRFFDPSRYLPGVRCPIFFVNGTNDFAYPLDSYQKCYRLVPGRVDLRIEVRMPHSHPDGWNPQEIGLYVDSVLSGGRPLPRLHPIVRDGGNVSATFRSATPVVKGELHYTTDEGPWQKRNWLSVPAKIVDNRVVADLPQGRPLAFYLSVTDRRGAMVSTAHGTLRRPNQPQPVR